MRGEVGTEDDQAKFGKLGFEGCNAPAEYDLYEKSETVGNRREPTVTERWQDDLGEYARHIWEYWRPRWAELKLFPYFGEAIRLVVLYLLSSALVERDFSQYVAIDNCCGNALRKPMLHNRMLSRCNKNEYEHCVFVQELIEQLLKERLDKRAGRTVNAGDGNAEEVAV